MPSRRGTFDMEEVTADLQSMSNQEAMDKYDVSLRTVCRWRATYKLPSVTPKRGAPYIGDRIPESTTPTWDKYFKIESTRVMVLSDVEIPDHDAEMLELALSIAEKYKISDLILNGDFLALDSFSSWAKQTAYRLAFKEEMEPAYQILRAFLKQFKHIWWLSGNHERRLPIMVGGEITIGDFLDKLLGVEFSEYSHCVLTSGGEEWFICHQKNYRQVPMSAPRAIFQSRLCHILASHGHHQGICKDPSGQFWLVEGGSARNPNHTKYKNLRITTHPQWNLGFTVIIDGQPLLVNKENAHLYIDNFGLKKEKPSGKK